MSFPYLWKNNEANFVKPVTVQVPGGMHITLEIIPKWNGQYLALRRPSIPGHEAPPHASQHPAGLLYFCHDLIRYGESIDHCVKRIVQAQTGAGVKVYRVVDIESVVQTKDDQWAFTPLVIASLSSRPKVGIFGNRISQVVEFTQQTVPDDFAWWTKREVEQFLEDFDDED